MSFTIKNNGGEVQGNFTQLEKLIENLEGSHYVDIGILGEKNQSAEGGLTLAGVGAVHEFGTDIAGRGNNTKIPERSFIRMPLETGQDDIEKAVDIHMKENLRTGNIRQIFEEMGIAGVARIEEAFASEGFGEWEPNAESTVLAKGSDSPLIDDGTLRQGMSYKVGGDK